MDAELRRLAALDVPRDVPAGLDERVLAAMSAVLDDDRPEVDLGAPTAEVTVVDLPTAPPAGPRRLSWRLLAAASVAAVALALAVVLAATGGSNDDGPIDEPERPTTTTTVAPAPSRPVAPDDAVALDGPGVHEAGTYSTVLGAIPVSFSVETEFGADVRSFGEPTTGWAIRPPEGPAGGSVIVFTTANGGGVAQSDGAHGREIVPVPDDLDAWLQASPDVDIVGRGGSAGRLYWDLVAVAESEIRGSGAGGAVDILHGREPLPVSVLDDPERFTRLWAFDDPIDDREVSVVFVAVSAVAIGDPLLDLAEQVASTLCICELTGG